MKTVNDIPASLFCDLLNAETIEQAREAYEDHSSVISVATEQEREQIWHDVINFNAKMSIKSPCSNKFRKPRKA